MESPAIVAFGPFQLDARARLLQKDGKHLALGGRAFDILCVLVQNAGKLVTKRDLLAGVWQDVSVDEGSLRFHISALRKTLGDADPSGRYVETLAGRGYCFVAPVAGARAQLPVVPVQPAAHGSSPAPTRLMRMVGREDIVEHISQELLDKRFVTLVGPGGIGKTTVAAAVMHRAVPTLGDTVCFADLGPLTELGLVPAVAAAAVGLAVQSEDPTTDLVTFLRDKRLLLVLDCCEPVIEAVAALAERLYQETPGVHLLATSRETLRVEGEHVIQIPSLEIPPDQGKSSFEEMLKYPAAQLFAERAAASGWRSKFSDADALIVTGICRKLDGIPLAIELAAGLVNAYGIEGTADLLNKRFARLHQGRRTALPRHRTLEATLDWSYEFLSQGHREVFWQLAVFAGPFTLDAVREVVRSEVGESTEDVLARLIAKSLVAVETGHRLVRYRLLETTRAYGLQKLADSGQIEGVARRHAQFFSRLLPLLDFNLERASDAFKAHREHLGNVRAALNWTFSESGDLQLGVSLAAAAAPFYLELSLLIECRRWCARAIEALDDSTRGGPFEIQLQAALGLSTMFTEGNGDKARFALERGLMLAEKGDEIRSQLQLVGRLHFFNNMVGNNREAFDFAKRSYAIAEKLNDPVAIAAAHSLLGATCHLGKCQKEAYEHLEVALAPLPLSQSMSPVHLGINYRHRAGICMARTLWLLGFSDRAAILAKQTVEEAANHDHPVTLCIALTWAANICLWTGDWETAAGYISRLEALASSRSIMHYPSAGSGLRGYLLIQRGDAETGVPLVESSLEGLYRHRYHLLTTLLQGGLAEGYATLGKYDQALDIIGKSLLIAEQAGEVFNQPELLRIKGDILAVDLPSGHSSTEACYRHAQKLASQQSAIAWELRIGNSLARLWSDQGRADEAVPMLESICARFTEGFDSPDFKRARHLTARLPTSKSP